MRLREVISFIKLNQKLFDCEIYFKNSGYLSMFTIDLNKKDAIQKMHSFYQLSEDIIRRID